MARRVSLLLATLLAGLPISAAELRNVRSGEHGHFSRLVFELDAPTGYRLDRCGPDRVVISLDAVAPSHGGEIALRGSRFRHLALENTDAGLRALLELASGELRTREMILAQPNRIVIDFEEGEGTPVAASTTPSCANPVAEAPMVAEVPPAPPIVAPDAGVVEWVAGSADTLTVDVDAASDLTEDWETTEPSDADWDEMQAPESELVAEDATEDPDADWDEVQAPESELAAEDADADWGDDESAGDWADAEADGDWADAEDGDWPESDLAAGDAGQATDEIDADRMPRRVGADRARVAWYADAPADETSRSRISDAPAPLRTREVPERPLTLEIGNPFLGRGIVWEGFELPTGAVWQPSLLVYGASRIAVQGQHDRETRGEVVARVDLFANLQLSGTERFLIGIRPLDRDGKFTGYTFLPGSERDRQTEFNSRIETLFFEGDIGEIFPFLDPGDSRMLDVGFAVGRQPLRLQEGLLLNDTIDSVGVVRNNLLPPGASNLRMTALYGWDQIHRGDNQRDRFSKLYGLLTSADLPWSTMDLDLLFVESQDRRGGDGLYAGLSSVQRIRSFNTALRATGSLPLDGRSAAVDRGLLLFGELSWTPPVVHDLLYLNAFWGIGDFTSAARGPDAGGPLARTGLLFEAYGIGNLGAPLGNDAGRSAGGALGYQMFLGGIRRQLILELGGRHDTFDDDWGVGAAARFQQALGQRHVLQIDAAVSETPDDPVTPSVRVEWRMRF